MMQHTRQDQVKINIILPTYLPGSTWFLSLLVGKAFWTLVVLTILEESKCSLLNHLEILGLSYNLYISKLTLRLHNYLDLFVFQAYMHGNGC